MKYAPNVQALVDLSGFMAGILGLQFAHFCYTYIRCSSPGRLHDHKGRTFVVRMLPLYPSHAYH